MKSISVLLFALAAFAASAQASSPEVAQIVREREATLSRVVTLLEGRYETGVGDERALFMARIALATFRRDAAPSVEQKAAQQEAVVALREKRLADLQARAKAGLADEIDLLTATDELLAARQARLEMK